MDNNERSAGGPLPAKDSQIQLVVSRPEDDETTIDLGRVFHNMKLKLRIFAWVMVLCLVLGVCAPLLMYQFTKKPLTVTSVVTLRYDVPSGMKGLLVAPDGSALDLSTVTSSPVLQKALEGLALSKPLTIENLRNNLTVTRVLTEDSSRTKEALAGLADLKNVQVYNRLEETELQYQNRFIVSLSNHFGDEDARVKIDLKDEELGIILNRILDAYNDTLIKQYADVSLPENRVAAIDLEVLDIPEALDSLDAALDDLYKYCGDRPEQVRAYRSWSTGLNLDDWMRSIRTVQSVNLGYLDANVYANGLMRDKDSVALTFRYRIRTLQSELDKVYETIESNKKLLTEYKNDSVLVNMQESDSAREARITTDYFNRLVLQQQAAYADTADLKIQIAETQNKLDRLETVVTSSEIAGAEAELANAITGTRNLFEAVRAHMTELFGSPLFSTYSEHSAPQGKSVSFLQANMKMMIIGAVAGLVIACGLWFLAGMAPEFAHREKDPKEKASGKEAAKA